MENRYTLEFAYNRRGFGDLIFYDRVLPALRYRARTGSIDKTLTLVNNLRPTTWYIITPSVYTEEPAMVITHGKGRKIRLWLALGSSGKYERTSFLIHPDGGSGGSKGCIVLIKEDGVELFKTIDAALVEQKIIPVHVRHIQEVGA